ncbi:MAG: hypothetical protein QOF14_3714 [Hyphomicrobiales bacterium]|nr:hypothetical protein [Hyphomicrobiales bacterium]
MTVSLQLRDFAEAKAAIAAQSLALVLDFIGEDAGGWAAWTVRKGGCVEAVGSVHEAPDGAVVVRLHDPSRER